MAMAAAYPQLILLQLLLRLGAVGALQAHQEPEAVVHAALERLRGMWPGGRGERILAAAAEAIPSRDEGRALRRRLARRYSERRPFVFAAFGSSVSAGHDNYPNQSWPFELERMLKPTFQALGLDFEVRQRAMGGYGEMPFSAGCLSGRGGEGLDAVSWEYGMFYDPACEGYHFLQEAHDALSQEDLPPVVFALAGTNIEFGDSIVQTTDERRNLRSSILSHGDDAEFGDHRPWRENEWYFTQDFVSSGELERWSRQSSLQVTGMRRSLNPRHYLQTTGAAAVFDKGDFGFYPIQTAAATNLVVYDAWYQAREKAFNINWHPGPLGHTLIAAQLAHFILGQLGHAVKDSDRGRPWGHSHHHVDQSKHEGDNPLVGKDKMPQMPGGRFCGSMMTKKCFSGVEQPPSALWSLRSAGSKDSWEYENSIQSITGWMGQIDQRKVFRGTPSTGELMLELFVPGPVPHYALVCGAPCGWHCRAGFGYVAAPSQRWWPESRGPRAAGSDLSFRVDGEIVPDSELLELHSLLFDDSKGKYCPGCKNAADVCQPVGKLPPGQHQLGLAVHEQWRKEDKEETYVEVVQVVLVAEA